MFDRISLNCEVLRRQERNEVEKEEAVCRLRCVCEFHEGRRQRRNE